MLNYGSVHLALDGGVEALLAELWWGEGGKVVWVERGGEVESRRNENKKASRSLSLSFSLSFRTCSPVLGRFMMARSVQPPGPPQREIDAIVL